MSGARQELLIEIGTEELPPRSLPALRDAFAGGIAAGLRDAGLVDDTATAQPFASPRRIAVLVSGVLQRQPDQQQQRRGPAIAAAFDDQGNPTRAALGFAKSCGVEVAALERLSNDKGEWLHYSAQVPGRDAAQIVPDVLASTLATLPIARRMRWGDGSAGEFVRPVHWVVALLGEQVLPLELYGLRADRISRGHRFLAEGPVTIRRPGDYEQALVNAFVVPDFDQRRDLIREQLACAARQAGGEALVDDELLDEVTSLVEWPRTVTGGFDDEFLQVAPEVLVATMQDHQKYFALRDSEGRLLPGFITVTNMEASDAALIRTGNERVLRARFNDARFFWRSDLATPLEDLVDGTRTLTFQNELGSVHDKAVRMTELGAALAAACGADMATVTRAGALAKADLVSRMVFEFTDLQGVMGQHYARHAGEQEAVAVAITEHYLPRFAGDVLPSTPAGTALALADRLDTLAGIFAIGAQPTGDKDPFGLRRAALGVIRIAVERGVEFDLDALLSLAREQLPLRMDDAVAADLRQFITDRLRGYLAGRGFRGDSIEAVLALAPRSLPDAVRRLEALESVRGHPDLDQLAAMDKRTRNILAKAGGEGRGAIDDALLIDPAEKALAQALARVGPDLQRQVAPGAYAAALNRAGDLAPLLTVFFDEVLVMAEENELRRNRLALVGAIRSCLTAVADLAHLQG